MQMRCMVLVKADKDSEAGILPDQQLLTEMGQYNEALARDRRALRRDEGVDCRLLALV